MARLENQEWRYLKVGRAVPPGERPVSGSERDVQAELGQSVFDTPGRCVSVGSLGI